MARRVRSHRPKTRLDQRTRSRNEELKAENDDLQTENEQPTAQLNQSPTHDGEPATEIDQTEPSTPEPTAPEKDSNRPSTSPDETDITTIRAVSDDAIKMAFGEEGITLTYGASQQDTDCTTVQVSADETIGFGDDVGPTRKTLLLDEPASNATIRASAADTIGTEFDGTDFHMDLVQGV